MELHQDRATSQTCATTSQFLQQMERETGIKAIPFTDIPVKSPDVSPMDFCAFGLLKSALAKRRPKTVAGLWKCMEEVLLSWKFRCRLVIKGKGHQIEHYKKIFFHLSKSFKNVRTLSVFEEFKDSGKKSLVNQ